MPRVKNQNAFINIIIRENFTLVEGKQHEYWCNHCNKEKALFGKTSNNLKVHLKTKHAGIYETKYGLDHQEKLELETMRLKLLQCFTEITTVNMRPYSILEDSGYVNSISEKLHRLDTYKRKISIPEDVQKYTAKLSSEIREIIAKECRYTLISIMIDTVTRGKRSILGIIIRYVVNGDLFERCIGMVELFKTHNAVNLSNEIKIQLLNNGIKPKQVIAITTDNARNMQATVRQYDESLYGRKQMTIETYETDLIIDDIMDDNADCENNYFSNEENINQVMQILSSEFTENELAIIEQTINENETHQNLMEDAYDFNDVVDEAIHLLENDFIADTPFKSIFNLRCAAHTLQLCIKDAFKASSLKKIMISCRRVAILLRKQQYVHKAREKGIQISLPRLNTATRWSSDLRMVIFFKFSANYFHVIPFKLLTSKNTFS